MNNIEAWYETKLFIALLSATVTICVFILGQILSRRLQKKNDKRNTLILITQSNATLFSLIYRGSMGEGNIDFIKLREELIKTNVVFILPEDLKEEFKALYKIYFSGPDHYDENYKQIYKILKNIIAMLNNYGVETFGY